MIDIQQKIIILVTLIFLLCIFSKSMLISDIISFFIILILTNEMINKLEYSIIVTIVIFILLKSIVIQSPQSQYMENFDEKSNFKDDDIETKAFKEKEDNGIPDMKNVQFNEKDLNERNEFDKTDDIDKIIDKADNSEKNPSTEKKNASDLEPFEAQKETFELINTVKTLSQTIKELGPALSEGRKVLDLYKNFKF